MWLMDRLAPQSELDAFEPYLAEPLGLYAWGRRLGMDRRAELLQIQFPDSTFYPRRQRFIQAAMYAWCDSCPDGDLATLLEWPDHWGNVLNENDVHSVVDFAAEFHRRSADRDACHAELVKFLAFESAYARYPSDLRGKLAIRNAVRAFPLLLKDTADRHHGACTPMEHPFDWRIWFSEVLYEPEFAHLAELGDYVLGNGTRRLEYLANSFWIWRHGPDQWKQLGQYAYSHRERLVFDHLSTIVPKAELAEWDSHVLYRSVDNGEIRAYCHWMPAEYAETLRVHFDHPDGDWAACAYQNYLAKVPEPVLQHFWRRGRDLPSWQAKLLDRRLFAPEPVRPDAVVNDVRDVGADLRLEDPFNDRGF